MTPYKHNFGQTIDTDVSGVSALRHQVAHHPITAAQAAAESDTAVLALTVLGTAAATVTTGLTSPAVPRNVKVDCSKAGITSNVTVNGTNFAGDAIAETIALNGQTAAPGSLAFKTITSVVLPARTNVPAKQEAGVEVTQGAQAAGSTVFTFTSAATGAPFDVTVAFLAADDTPAEAAIKIVAALNANATFAAKWLASVSESTDVHWTSLTYEAQDVTTDLVVKTAGVSAITVGSVAAGVVSGVAEDKVSVGLGKKFGIPYLLTADELVIVKLFNNSADTGTVTADATDIEKNVIELNGTADGLKPIDLYILV